MADHNHQQAPAMRKWEIHLHDGIKFTMLSEQCQTEEQALAAAREKWGDRVKCVI